ncbi:uncharacterized protein LOC127242016 [Andrographis paniculata]|uniref:uncharacterized protein LOC127242016 n=1 Tax=Andrographis paniculata TaxID=175694 RepID=UPI0021E79B6A|nr:uncharacterized protein LOC127242016 [Andrographis paniculata]
MNTIFHDLIGQSVEVYIDGIMVKSKSFSEHLVNLEQAFRRMRHYNLKMNPAKCAFGVSSRNFLGFMVQYKGIEVDSNKTKAIINARPLENLKQLQGFFGQVNIFRRFVSNAAGKLKVFSMLLKLRKTEKFVWTLPHQQAFEAIKEALTNPPVLMPPQAGRPLRLYVSATENTVGCLLVQEAPDRSERAIFYLSNVMNDAETSPMPWILKFDGSSTQTNAEAGSLSRAHGEESGPLLDHWHPDLLIIKQRKFKSGRVCLCPVEVDDWRMELRKYLDQPTGDTHEKLRKQALKFTLIDGDLFRRAADGMLLKCVDTQKAMKVMGEVHKGVCGAHKSGLVMRWTIRRYGYFLPSMTEDCIKYAQGCEACQRHGHLIQISAEEMHTVVKTMAIPGMGDGYYRKNPSAILQATLVHIGGHGLFHKMDRSCTIGQYQGTGFTSDRVVAFATQYGITLLHSSPYYAQANGQAEVANKILIGVIKKVVEDNPRRWHKVLGEALWTCRQYRNKSTGCTPFHLVYGQEAILPLEITVPSLRVLKQNLLNPEQYATAMLQRLDDVHEDRMMALDNIQVNKARVARAYNNKVRRRTFYEGDLVWKTVLPEGFKDNTFGKWSHTWEGPYQGNCWTPSPNNSKLKIATSIRLRSFHRARGYTFHRPLDNKLHQPWVGNFVTLIEDPGTYMSYMEGSMGQTEIKKKEDSM